MKHKLKHVPQVLVLYSLHFCYVVPLKVHCDDVEPFLFHQNSCSPIIRIFYIYVIFIISQKKKKKEKKVICLIMPLNSQKTAYSGCLGKTFRFTSGQYMSVVSTLQRCATHSAVSGEVTVLVAVKIMIHGIKIHSST